MYNTFYVVTGEDLASLKDTSGFLHKIYERLDKEDTFIFEQRKKLEIQAAEDSKTYLTKMKFLMIEVEKLK